MTPQTLRKERRRKFRELICKSEIYMQSRLDVDTLDEELNELCKLLADAAESRSERMTDEQRAKYITAPADKKVDAIIEFEKQAHAAEEAGQAYRGREFLVGSDYLPYGDWYHKVTGWQMYPKKGKAKQDGTVMTEFKKWWENDLTLEALQVAYDIENGWRKDKSGQPQNITHPRELTAKAIAVNAAPDVKSTSTEYRPKIGV